MMTEQKVISVLGKDIQILFRNKDADTKLKNCVGYFDSSKGWIVINSGIGCNVFGGSGQIPEGSPAA